MTNAGSEGGQTNNESPPQISRAGKWVIGAGLVVAVALTVVVAAISPDPNISPESAAGVLALVAAGAVAIERILEGVWMLVGLGTKNTWWPMNRASQAVDSLVGNLDEELKGVYSNAMEIVEGIAQAKNWSAEQLENARQDIENIRNTTLTNLQTLAENAPANQRLQLVAATVDRSLSFLESKYPDLERAMLIAGRSIDIAADFVATFKDNPGRRLISIGAGAILGLIAAWALGLDAFQAAYQAPPEQVEAGASPEWQWGIALTGLLMGLGSTPTHEVIKLVQEVKESRKAENREL
jgi:hypothetical protein